MNAATSHALPSRDEMLVMIGQLELLATMAPTAGQRETAAKMVTRMQSLLPLVDATAANKGEPTVPEVHASTLDWFRYYREMIAFLSRELPRLRAIENAAMRVAAARRGKIVTDQAPLDALDQALEAQS